jgi:hypothetical protein
MSAMSELDLKIRNASKDIIILLDCPPYYSIIWDKDKPMLESQIYDIIKGVIL